MKALLARNSVQEEAQQQTVFTGNIYMPDDRPLLFKVMWIVFRHLYPRTHVFYTHQELELHPLFVRSVFSKPTGTEHSKPINVALSYAELNEYLQQYITLSQQQS